MTSNQPLVSVLMTAYNRSNYIGVAIESVLASTYSNFELIVVDDCSTDDTPSIVESYSHADSRIRFYTNEKNLGDYPNRNMAASYAKGTYIKYIDSDNIIYPFGLGVMVDCIERFPEAGYGLLSESDPKEPYPVCVSPRQAYIENFFGEFGYFGRAPDSSIIRKSAFDSLGGFTGKNMIGDLEMWMRLSQRYHVVKLPAYLGWDRVHEGQEKNIDPVEYQRLRDEIKYNYLRSPECPLSKHEILNAICDNKKNQRKQSLKLMASGHIGLAWRFFALTFRLR